MIVIVDYEAGNIASVLNMIRKAGGDAIVSGRADDIKRASKLILPGVGSFDHGITHLQAKSLPSVMRERVVAGVPLLGICLGMQLLALRSEEGVQPGLGLIRANFKRFGRPDLRVPHMGWNTLNVTRKHPLLDNIGEEDRYYFAHSYYALCEDPADVLATTDYGGPFVSAYAQANVVGVQFHPEKSHRFGLRLMKRFLEM
ncbi:MAG: Imidazole glycerol phosphate synthase subunit HisH [Steroidobacteraceae bacterium]|nr:Imidazole glycerol phosphate synthase subunit HisH [Steroidobacteraceae bacterium]